ncbi:hypothetical protein L1887_43998 [Cichorium endivia]|nr:hypothetical protein L1887_43998 [Cichorium endivia]
MRLRVQSRSDVAMMRRPARLTCAHATHSTIAGKKKTTPWEKKLEQRRKQESIKQRERDMKAEKEAESDRKKQVTRERKQMAEEKARLEIMAQKVFSSIARCAAVRKSAKVACVSRPHHSSQAVWELDGKVAGNTLPQVTDPRSCRTEMHRCCDFRVHSHCLGKCSPSERHSTAEERGFGRRCKELSPGSSPCRRLPSAATAIPSADKLELQSHALRWSRAKRAAPFFALLRDALQRLSRSAVLVSRYEYERRLAAAARSSCALHSSLRCPFLLLDPSPPSILRPTPQKERSRSSHRKWATISLFASLQWLTLLYISSEHPHSNRSAYPHPHPPRPSASSSTSSTSSLKLVMASTPNNARANAQPSPAHANRPTTTTMPSASASGHNNGLRPPSAGVPSRTPSQNTNSSHRSRASAPGSKPPLAAAEPPYVIDGPGGRIACVADTLLAPPAAIAAGPAADKGSASAVMRQHMLQQPGLPLSQFSDLLVGKIKLNVPVFTVWGACEDVAILERFRTGEYQVNNLHVLDEASTKAIEVGGVRLRLFGLGGAVVLHKLFDNGEGAATIAGGQGTMWTTALQIGELVDTAQKTFDPTETRVLITHASPGREGLLAQLALALKADLTISAGLHFRYGVSYNEFSVQHDAENYRNKLQHAKHAFGEIWGHGQDPGRRRDRREPAHAAQQCARRRQPRRSHRHRHRRRQRGACLEEHLELEPARRRLRTPQAVSPWPPSPPPDKPRLLPLPLHRLQLLLEPRRRPQQPQLLLPPLQRHSAPTLPLNAAANAASNAGTAAVPTKVNASKPAEASVAAAGASGAATPASKTAAASPASAKPVKEKKERTRERGHESAASRSDFDGGFTSGTDGRKSPSGPRKVRNPFTLYVSQLKEALPVTEDELRTYFGPAAAGITGIKLVFDKPHRRGASSGKEDAEQQRRQRPFAYVEFRDEAAMAAGFKRQGEAIKGDVKPVLEQADSNKASQSQPQQAEAGASGTDKESKRERQASGRKGGETDKEDEAGKSADDKPAGRNSRQRKDKAKAEGGAKAAAAAQAADSAATASADGAGRQRRRRQPQQEQEEERRQRRQGQEGQEGAQGVQGVQGVQGAQGAQRGQGDQGDQGRGACSGQRRRRQGEEGEEGDCSRSRSRSCPRPRPCCGCGWRRKEGRSDRTRRGVHRRRLIPTLHLVVRVCCSSVGPRRSQCRMAEPEHRVRRVPS